MDISTIVVLICFFIILWEILFVLKIKGIIGTSYLFGNKVLLRDELVAFYYAVLIFIFLGLNILLLESKWLEKTIIY